jgi:hypothetical protein
LVTWNNPTVIKSIIPIFQNNFLDLSQEASILNPPFETVSQFEKYGFLEKGKGGWVEKIKRGNLYPLGFRGAKPVKVLHLERCERYGFGVKREGPVPEISQVKANSFGISR